MLSVPKDIYGINVFRIMLHEIGIKRAMKMLDVSERTIWRWLSTEKVPKAAVLALYWESSYGRSLIECEMVNEIRMLYKRLTLLQEQYIRAKDIVAGLRRLHAGTANEPIFEELVDCNEKERIQSQFIALDSCKYSSSLPTHQADQSGLSPKPQADKGQAVKARPKVASA